MANVFSKNAYNILALETDASFKDINRKAKELIQLSKIGETDIDGAINLPVPNRGESAINEALNNLNSPKKKLREYFFWFDNNDEVDRKFLDLLRKSNLDEAVELLTNKANGDTINALLKKKNLAILQTILLLHNDKTYLKESLENWKAIVDSDKYWKSFEKIYEASNEEDIETEVIDDFRSEVPKFLADAYFEASEKEKSVFAEFRKYFKVKGVGLEKKVANPVLNSALLSIEKLEKMNISEDGVITDEEVKEVSTAIEKIKEQFGKLADYDLYDDSETKVLRDRASAAIRGIVLDIHNQLGETERGIGLLEIALDIAGTKAQINKIKEDLSVLHDVLKQGEILSPIDKLIEKEKFGEAIDLVKSKKQEFSKDKNLTTYLDDKLKAVVALFVMKLDREGWDAFNAKNWAKSSSKFKEIEGVLSDYIEIFNFNKKGLEDYLGNISIRVAGLTVQSVGVIDDIVKEVRDSAKENFSDTWEQFVLIGLADSRVIPRGIELIKKIHYSFFRMEFFNPVFYVLGFLLSFYLPVYNRYKTS
ncbi:MAG: hypothetical protein WCO18_02245 [bacterium]